MTNKFKESLPFFAIVFSDFSFCENGIILEKFISTKLMDKKNHSMHAVRQ